jgi:hypothetical protein
MSPLTTAVGFKALILTAPSTQLDHSLFPLIEKWDDPEPTALQVLEVLDQITHFSLASTFTLALIEHVFVYCIEREKTTRAELYEQADLLWRKDFK